MNSIQSASHARALLKTGKIIAYPTEAVFGLGCDPFNQAAVERLIALKQRPESKGFIVLVSNWLQLQSLIGSVSDAQLQRVRATWPGPVTWIFPKSPHLPSWLTGEHDGIAVRMSAHPVAFSLCLESPIVSTSANISGQLPVKTQLDLLSQFPYGIDAIVAGELGGNLTPTSIFDVVTGKQLR